MKTNDLDSVYIRKDTTTCGKLVIDEFNKAWDFPNAWEYPKVWELNADIAYKYEDLEGKILKISIKKDSGFTHVFGTDELTGVTYLLNWRKDR